MIATLWGANENLIMQMSFMRMQMQMQMQMYMLVMHGSFMRMQMQMYVMPMFEPILMDVQKFIEAFLFKNRLSCLTLNFSDHHHEFFQGRSIWYFKKV